MGMQITNEKKKSVIFRPLIFFTYRTKKTIQLYNVIDAVGHTGQSEEVGCVSLRVTKSCDTIPEWSLLISPYLHEML